MLKCSEATFHKWISKINNLCLESLQYVFLNLNMTCLEIQNNLLAQFLFFSIWRERKIETPSFYTDSRLSHVTPLHLLLSPPLQTLYGRTK